MKQQFQISSLDKTLACCPFPAFQSVSNLSDLRELISAEIRSLGFSDYQLIINKAGQGELSTLPRALTESYHAQGLEQYDLVAVYRIENKRSIYYSTIHTHIQQAPLDCYLVRGMQAIYRLNSAHGYYDYYCTVSDNNQVMLMVSIQHVNPHEFKQYVNGKESTLQLLTTEIAEIGTRRFPDNFCNPSLPHISTKLLQVLTGLIQKDMSINEVAKSLGISAITAHQHMGKVRRILRVRTNIGAVVKAMKLGLIEMGH